MLTNLYQLIQYACIILCFLFTPLYSQNKSYFFTNEQSNEILNKIINPTKSNKKKKKRKRVEYKLSGICYLSQHSWTVWINGQTYNKIGQYTDFSIDEVTSDSVTITTLDCKTIHLTVRCDACEANTNNITNIENKPIMNNNTTVRDKDNIKNNNLNNLSSSVNDKVENNNDTNINNTITTDNNKSIDSNVNNTINSNTE